MDDSEGEFACPECGATLPAGARFCPGCATALSADGEAVDLDDPDRDPFADADVDLDDISELFDDDVESLVELDEEGNRRAARRIRVLSGLAVSLPLAPLSLFLASVTVDLTLATAALAFLLGWLGPAALLARSRVPVIAFGRSLYLVAVCTAMVPVALAVNGAQTSVPVGVEFGTLTAIALTIAAVALGLGKFVTAQARVPTERAGDPAVRGSDE
jgi:hypothetical protein